jgi:hypothetical protein
MKIESIYRYYEFGYNYNNLLGSQSWTNETLLKALSQYFDFVAELELPVTLSGISMKGLDGERETLRELVRQEEMRTKPVENKLLQRIREKLNKIDSILDAELYTRQGYIPSEKRYPLKYLTNSIGQLFASGVYDALPRIARYDFKECGMCLALDRYTACAFHILRGTEDVLKLYCGRILGKEPTANATWGSFLKLITTAVTKKCIKPNPPEELLLNLESLRKYYRNKTQHPTMIYSCDDVQDLLGLCIKTVNEIMKDLSKRKPAS